MDLLLVDELCSFIETLIQSELVDTLDKGLMAPRVVNGYLPPKRDDGRDDDEEPLVLVRLVEGQDEWHAERGMAVATVHTLIAVRTASEDVKIGPKTTLSLMNRIRIGIYAARFLPSMRYRVEYPLKWKAPEPTTWPLWQGEMNVPWIIPIPQEIREVHEFADER
jgi:hypothetical protein